jgi:hypothetical protein
MPSLLIRNSPVVTAKPMRLLADGAEEIGGLVAEIAPAARPLPLREPPSAGSAGLADPGLVEKPDLDPLGLGLGRRDFVARRFSR